MKHRANTVKSETNSRTTPLGDLTSQRVQQGLDISPNDIGRHGILEDRFKRLALTAIHVGDSIIRRYRVKI